MTQCVSEAHWHRENTETGVQRGMLGGLVCWRPPGDHTGSTSSPLSRALGPEESSPKVFQSHPFLFTLVCFYTTHIVFPSLQHQLSGPPRPAPDEISYSYHASAPGFQDLSSNSSMKPSVYLCKVLPWFPIGQRVQAPPHIQRGPTPLTPAPTPASWDPRFIPAPLSSQPFRCQIT